MPSFAFAKANIAEGSRKRETAKSPEGAKCRGVDYKAQCQMLGCKEKHLNIYFRIGCFLCSKLYLRAKFGLLVDIICNLCYNVQEEIIQSGLASFFLSNDRLLSKAIKVIDNDVFGA